MTDLVQTVLTGRRDVGAAMKLVTLTPPPDVAASYRAPGQYVEVRFAGTKGYFALAGELVAPSWELLVRMNGGTSDALTMADEGTVFDVRGALGQGFPLEMARARPLAVAVAGSALAVTRPILRDRIAHREGPLTSVYVGVRSPREVPLADEIAGWTHAGATVVLCLSREDAPTELPGVRRAMGYVQRVLAGEVASDAVVFAAGPAAMLEDIRALPLDVVTNV